ncbi:Regulatory protein AfsR [Saccharomonospora xinjiangensis]|uniref:AfsR/SARP family transcriptional regulator n=1 Tax=Saccharomonospora xinjiangensis TaxID=75294 RepID=UPI0010705882|nr:BTAD domain-containing putative transcriptional regulator [Saccharomonospora xinjiangensis]QBQ60216.1 Regulatory protein AfsR [Saccharomonospora xinjiangensis]
MAEIRFRLLGPLSVRIDGREVALGGRKPRLVLAALLLEAGSPVATDTLIDVVWPSSPPRSAVANLRTYVHSLRRLLTEDRIERVPSGYRIAVARGELDTAVFAGHVAAAREAMADDRPADVLAELARAVPHWQGPPLADLPHHHTWKPELARLGEVHLAAHELRVRARLALGEYGEVVPELRELLARHPLREELWSHLVVALDRCGRRAEAVDAYNEAVRVLRDELDAAPGPHLRALRSRLGTPPSAPRRRENSRVVCQLPLDLPDFTGRERHIADVIALARRRRSEGNPTVVVLSGPPGVGKSSLAVHIAHRLRREVDEGHLYVGLAATTSTPRRPLDVLAELLRSLGLSDSMLPPAEAERAAALRSALTGHSLCVVLDDAASAAQVRPLLPGAGTSVILVTARTRLPDLVEAHHVELDVLDHDPALRLFRGIVGEDRVAAEPEQAARIVAACGRLPLALRVAGARLAQRRHLSLAHFADRIADERRRLDELRAGDLAVRAGFELSYARLPTGAATAFRVLGMLGAVGFPGWTVAAALDAAHTSRTAAEDGKDSEDGEAMAAADVLDVLVDTHLVELVGTGATGAPRYRMHDLLRCYAADRAGAEDTARVRRVVEGYYAAATAAVERMPVRFFGVRPTPVPRSYWRPHDLGRLVADPIAWFDSEHDTAAALVELAARHAADEAAWRLATALTPFYDLRNRWEDWWRTNEVALAAARRTGDRHGEAIILRDLGQVHVYQDRYREALDLFARSAALFARLQDAQGEAVALAGRGTVHRIRGDTARALACGRRALELFSEAGDLYGEAAARIAIGTVRMDSGALDEAETWFADAHALASAIGDRHRAAHALHRQALLHQRRGSLGAARQQLDQAIAVFDDLGDDHCAGYAQQSLGELCLSSGELAHAQLLLGNSLAVHRDTGDRRSEATVSQRLGELHESLGQPHTSRAYFERALSLWRELAAQPQQTAVERKLRLANDA